jgi:hypothetical protein
MLKNTATMLKRKLSQTSTMCNALFRNCKRISLSLAKSRSLFLIICKEDCMDSLFAVGWVL